ncbi:MAG: phospholipase D-like domain-containing protein [Holophagales bacterium]|nr:phospholipase D-like domain-containing protein [Holophagales bacterium]
MLGRSRLLPGGLLAATLALAALPTLARSDDGDPDQPAACPTSMSHVGVAVKGAIIKGSVAHSELTTCNDVPPDWLFYMPSNGVDFLYERLGERVASTQSSMVISSLNGGERMKHIAKGIQELHERYAGIGPKPLVRVLTGKALHAASVYNTLTSYLPRTGPSTWNVEVVAMNIGRPPGETWNHSKLSVQDSCLATTGSVELNGKSEMFMEIRGEAAAAAERYFDSVWGFYPETLLSTCKASNEDHCDDWCIEEKCWERNTPATPPCPKWARGGHTVFSLGRGQFGEWPGSHMDLSADRGIFAALEAATEEIFILQRSFELRTASPNHVPRLYTAIADAASRGVSVRVLIGDGVEPLHPSAEAIWNNLADSMEAYFDGLGLAPAQKRAAHANVRLGIINTHAKVFMVDRQAFYVGSQNFYPSGLQDGNVYLTLDLYEQGFLVDDALLTRRMAEQAEALWLDAQDTILPNPHIWNGTYEVSFQASGSGSSGSGSCTAMFQLEIERLGFEPPAVSFLCPGQFDGNPITVDAWIMGGLAGDGSAGGTLGGEVYPYYDSTTWTGQMVNGELSGSFSDLELGISYSGSFTGVPID